jgi:hypothetical protein
LCSFSTDRIGPAPPGVVDHARRAPSAAVSVHWRDRSAPRRVGKLSRPGSRSITDSRQVAKWRWNACRAPHPTTTTCRPAWTAAPHRYCRSLGPTTGLSRRDFKPRWNCRSRLALGTATGEQLAAALRAHLHVAPEVMEASGSHPAIVTTRWQLGSQPPLRALVAKCDAPMLSPRGG